jgi:hypothetical protein
MKAITTNKSWFSSFIIALILLVSCNERKETNSSTSDSDSVSIHIAADTLMPVAASAESVTFILGEDKSSENPYYAEATKYFNSETPEKTLHLVTSCRSLVEVRQYLTNHAPENQLPWGRINLVSHGDQWLGLSVKVTPDSRRATLERLQEFIDAGTFNPLPDSIIDENTEVALHACGIGNNKAFVETFGNVFRSKSAVPHVIAPRLFEFFSTVNQGESGRYQAKVWMVPYKKDEKPGDIILCNLLHEEYPNEATDWQDALTRTQPRFAGDTYHYTFDIPVNLVISLSANDTLPELSNTENILQWIDQQPEINHILSKIQIPADLFSWNLKKGFSKNKDGKKSVAVSVKGFCTMLCVLKPLVDNKPTANNQPFMPAVNDTAYFYTVKGKSLNLKS